MAIKGSLKEASLPDVIQLLHLGRRTGCLAVADRQSFGQIYFDEGMIAYASLVNRRDRLGDILVRSERITPAQLQAAIDRQTDHRDRKLGDLLVEAGALSRDELETWMRLQIEEAVYTLFTWTQGTFNFESGLRPETQDFVVRVNPEVLLLEGARRVDEWSQIEKKIPSLDLIFELDLTRLQHSGVSLTGEQSSVAQWLDGTHDVSAIVERSGLGEFAVGKALYGLVTAGFAQRVGRSSARRQPAPESRVAEHRNLGVAFYRTGMYDEALREFRHVLELRADDLGARFHLGLVHVRRRDWEQAIDVLKRAAVQPDATAAVLHALAYAYEHHDQLDLAEATLAEAARRGTGDDPRVALSQGVVAMRRGDLPRAEERLATARSLWGARQPVAAWFHFAGLAAALRGETERAVAVLEEGIGLHPHATMLYNDLAVVQERRGAHEAAARLLEHALLEESGLPHLHKNLGDYRYRGQQYDDAFEAYERVVRLAPDHGADVWLKLGNIHYRRGEQAAARAPTPRAGDRSRERDCAWQSWRGACERRDAGTCRRSQRG